MGSKITAKYSGMCKICGSDWNVGQIIFYQKQPKAICSDSECFNEQGGSVSNTFQSSFINLSMVTLKLQTLLNNNHENIMFKHEIQIMYQI